MALSSGKHTEMFFKEGRGGVIITREKNGQQRASTVINFSKIQNMNLKTKINFNCTNK